METKQSTRAQILIKGISNNDCRHRKVIDMADEQGFKQLSAMKDDPGFANLNWFTYFRLKATLEKFCKYNLSPSLISKGVTLPSDKMGKTLLDYVSCVYELLK